MTAVARDSRLIDEWIAELTRQGWTHFYFPNRVQPEAMASVVWRSGCVDVIELFAEADAFAFRAPRGQNSDPFKPAAVVWTYGGDPVWTIRAMLALPEPGSIDAPANPMVPPPMCRALPKIAARVSGQVMRPPSHPRQGGTRSDWF